jgi:hypothetical protein
MVMIRWGIQAVWIVEFVSIISLGIIWIILLGHVHLWAWRVLWVRLSTLIRWMLVMHPPRHEIRAPLNLLYPLQYANWIHKSSDSHPVVVLIGLHLFHPCRFTSNNMHYCNEINYVPIWQMTNSSNLHNVVQNPSSKVLLICRCYSTAQYPHWDRLSISQNPSDICAI